MSRNERLLLTYCLCVCLSWSFILTRGSILTSMRAILNFHAGRRFPTHELRVIGPWARSETWTRQNFFMWTTQSQTIKLRGQSSEKFSQADVFCRNFIETNRNLADTWKNFVIWSAAQSVFILWLVWQYKMQCFDSQQCIHRHSVTYHCLNTANMQVQWD